MSCFLVQNKILILLTYCNLLICSIAAYSSYSSSVSPLHLWKCRVFPGYAALDLFLIGLDRLPGFWEKSCTTCNFSDKGISMFSWKQSAAAVGLAAFMMLTDAVIEIWLMAVCELYWLLCTLHQRKTDSQYDGYVRLNMFCQGKLSTYGANPQQKQSHETYLSLSRPDFLIQRSPTLPHGHATMGTKVRKKLWVGGKPQTRPRL